MYCDDTVMYFQLPSVVTIVLVGLLDKFAMMSGLGFTFDKKGIVNQVSNFLRSLPNKYHEIKQFFLSPIGMSQFVNLYVLSKTTFWSQCKSTNLDLAKRQLRTKHFLSCPNSSQLSLFPIEASTCGYLQFAPEQQQ
eukprot:TRINITY_DN24754_c0_g1_i1.p2 TRINITY_DN24754_c0_g1~~TRINITY_DN24754_c0_g1_i1.p2  ORF type:complete len:136 (-),score=7.32 TRINITY_DN24754_c0_g1_i1:15-422(-)